MEKSLIFNIIGLSGVALVLSAYLALQLGKLQAKAFLYSLLNFLGSIFIVISLLHDWNLPSFVLNSCWAGISLYGMFQSLKIN